MKMSRPAATRAVMNSAANTPMMPAVTKSGSRAKYLAESNSDQMTAANVAICKPNQARVRTALFLVSDQSLVHGIPRPNIYNGIPAMKDVPTFIRNRCGSSTEPIFDYWAPFRSGDHDRDLAMGREHCKALLSFASECRSVEIIIAVLVAMPGQELGPVEEGFLGALSEKATYGSNPPEMGTAKVNEALSRGGTSIEELRFGEAQARAYLDVARKNHCPVAIELELVEAVTGRMSYGALSFIYTVCAAALLGCAH